MSFYRNRTRVSIVVDDYLPCYPGGLPCFAKNKDKTAFWVSIIEKAYAKMCGSYYSMESGSETDALVDFTGGLGFLLELKEGLPAETVWKLLLSYSRQHFLLGCANNKDREICGIIPSHAYGILGLYTVPLTSGQNVPLLRLRNPWGNSEWQGEWSDRSPRWREISPGVKREIGWTGDPDDGTFFMALPDFLACYEKIYLCKTLRDGLVRVDVTSRWETGKSAGGCSNCPTWMCNPQFTITVRERTQGFVVLTQGDVRKFGEKSGGGYVNSIGAMVFESCPEGLRLLTRHKGKGKDNDGNKVNKPGFGAHLAASCTYANVRERTIPVTFEPEKCPYIVVPAIFEAGTAANFRLSVFADAQAQPVLRPVREWPYSASLQGAWTPTLCGGCPNYPSWRANPRFGLYLYSTPGGGNDGGDVVITLSTVAAARDIDNAPSVGVCVLGDGEVLPGEQILMTSKKFTQNAFVLGSFPVGLQRPLVVVPCTFDPGFQGNFFISAYSQTPFKLIPL